MAVERLRGDGHVDGNGGSGTPDAGVEREQRLMTLLREVVAEHGRLRAAELLGVNYKTVKRVLESGRLTPLVRDALERLRVTREERGGAVEPEHGGALERRIERLEGGLDAAAGERRSGSHEPDVGAHDAAASPPEVRPGGTGRTGEPSVAEPAPAVAGMAPRPPIAMRRQFPDVVTTEPADDDAEAYGAAWPLVEEWRWLHEAHPHHGRGVRWLEVEARILALELTMLEDHGLTLPPETQPLRGFARKGQTGWRTAALRDTRRALGPARLWRWVRRACTLGLWWE